MESGRLRIYLTGRLAIAAGDAVSDERQFPNRQSRLVFAYLASERQRPVPRAELAEALWADAPPPSWEVALSALVSALRGFLARTGLPRSEVIRQAFGCYQLRLPPDTWVDREVAVGALDEAEGALRAGEPARAYGWAGVATAIARRPFLPGESGRWVEQQRAELRNLLVRGLDCFSEILAWNGELALAVKAAQEAVALEPLREVGYQRLMRLHAAMSNRADALRTYEQCRRLLVEELGVDPSPQTEAVYLEILRLA